jgi:DNA-binding Lrp family transcriptional regulator
MIEKLLKLDRIDVLILAELQANGRISNNDLAERVHLSASPCLQRVRKLEAAGYISSYGAHLSVAKLGDPQVVFTQVTLSSHTKNDFLKFEKQLAAQDELIEAHLVSGGFDYLLKFVTLNIARYQGLIDQLLADDCGIEKYFSFIVLRSPIVKHRLPLQKLINTSS